MRECRAGVPQQGAGLARTAAAQLDQMHRRRQRHRVCAVLRQQLRLAAGRVVVVGAGDLLEQLRAGRVVEILRRQAPRGRQQACPHIVFEAWDRTFGRHPGNRQPVAGIAGHGFNPGESDRRLG